MSYSNNFKIGDKVEVIEDSITGEILSISEAHALVRTEDGFEMEFALNELVPQMAEQQINFTGAQQKQADFGREERLKKQRKAAPKRPKTIPPMEVDLHIEKLVKDHKRLPHHELLEIQLDRAKRSIDLAIDKRIPKLVLIHGVGQGVLKAELEYLVGRYEGISYQAADYQKYGQGAMLIRLSQKASRH